MSPLTTTADDRQQIVAHLANLDHGDSVTLETQSGDTYDLLVVESWLEEYPKYDEFFVEFSPDGGVSPRYRIDAEQWRRGWGPLALVEYSDPELVGKNGVGGIRYEEITDLEEVVDVRHE